ncbi:hypothetical protein FACS189494_09960 [Spirochaetia bacterium]|nr:hypothetical protein FACS189494_09960 [Spirochaetia bacterium]
MAKKISFSVFWICAVFSSVVGLLSCNDETAISHVLGVSVQAPVWTGFKVVSGTQIDFEFSRPVNVLQASFKPDAEIEQTINGDVVSVIFTKNHSGGERLTADILVVDDDGNTLNVLLPLRTRNDRVPDFLINELRLEASKPKTEFIELAIKSDGNLGALRVFAASTSLTDAIYEFPPVEVKSGDYVILHLRTYPDQPGYIDELGSNIALATTVGTSDTPVYGRDLFVPANVKYLHKNDVVYIVDQDDAICDAVMFSDSKTSWDKNGNFSKAAELLAKQGAWFNAAGESVKTPAFEDAASSIGETATRTLCRNEAVADRNIAADWYVTVVSGNTPGKKNNTGVYSP